jgi:quercetin dioxygenase-like cupin family protein
MRNAARIRVLRLALLLLSLSGSAATARAQTNAAEAPQEKAFASSADVKAQISAMLGEMAPDQGFLWRPLVRDSTNVAAIEIWKRPGLPASHPDEAEYAIVLEGAGTLVMGGTLADPKPRSATLVEGSRIDGGTTRQLRPGDVLLIPAGTPHWFGIEEDRLVLLGIKLPPPNK